jgi:pimeloyl-ACP methyl ester carboxylesterase
MAGGASQGRIITSNGLGIYYREHGEGHALVLLHGATDTHRLWDPFIPILKRKYRVITPDSRGHGRSLNPAALITYQMMADDLAGLIQNLGLDKPYLFGYSDGGQAVLDFGTRYPEQAGALVIGGAWYRFCPSYQQAITRAGFPAPGEVDYPVYEQGAPKDWQERLARVHLDPRPDYPKILLEQLSRLWWTPLEYQEKDLRKITAPTLILMAERDEMIPLEQARELAGMIPGAQLAVIPEAGHNDLLVPGGLFLDILINFLDSQDSRD